MKPSIRAIAKKFNVYFDALRRRLNCGMQVNATPGKPTAFTREEENQLKEWIFELSDRGFAVSRVRCIQAANAMLNKKNKGSKKKQAKLTNRWW